MASFRREFPPEGLARVEVELWRGNLTVRNAQPGEAGRLESDWELAVAASGKTLRATQPVGVKRPLDLADLIGEQQVRVEIEGKVLFDRQIRHGGGDVEIVLPSSVREISCRTARGDICLEGIEAVADAHTGHGNLAVSGLSGNTSLSTGHGDLVAIDLEGARLEVFTGHGNVILGGRLAGAKVKTGHGDIICRVAAAEGDHELHTGRGNISLDLQDGVAVRIDASTRHGGIDSNLPLVKVGTSGPEGNFGQRLVGTAAGVGPTAKINLNTKAGDSGLPCSAWRRRW